MSCACFFLESDGFCALCHAGQRGALLHALPKRVGHAVCQPPHERLHLPGERFQTPWLHLPRTSYVTSMTKSILHVHVGSTYHIRPRQLQS